MSWTIITARREEGLVRKRERKLWQYNSLNDWIRNKSQAVSFFPPPSFFLEGRKKKAKVHEQMGLPKTKKLLHSKGNHQQNEKETYQKGENICKSFIC